MEHKTYITKSTEEMQKLGENFAKEIINLPKKDKAIILGLSGNLGAGKTTFLQGFASGLGIKEKVLSPTFVVLKRFSFFDKSKNFYHIDCYRLKDEKDIMELDFKEIIKNPENIVAIEWPERIKKVLPKNIIKINFKVVGENREVDFEN